MPSVGMLLPQRDRDAQALIGEGRWHADVTDHHVRRLFGDGGDRGGRVGDLAGHLVAAQFEQLAPGPPAGSPNPRR